MTKFLYCLDCQFGFELPAYPRTEKCKCKELNVIGGYEPDRILATIWARNKTSARFIGIDRRETDYSEQRERFLQIRGRTAWEEYENGHLFDIGHSMEDWNQFPGGYSIGTMEFMEKVQIRTNFNKEIRTRWKSLDDD